MSYYDTTETLDDLYAIPVKVKRLRDDVPLPKYATEGAAGFDLCAASDVIIGPGETALVPTGLAFEIPANYELQVRPRSGISLKTKLRIANGPGTVDSDFRAEVGVIVDNIYANTFGNVDYYPLGIDGEPLTRQPQEYETGTYIIRKGDRLAQAVLAPVERAAFEVVEELTETERGAGGYGSTGTTYFGNTRCDRCENEADHLTVTSHGDPVCRECWIDGEDRE